MIGEERLTSDRNRFAKQGLGFNTASAAQQQSTQPGEGRRHARTRRREQPTPEVKCATPQRIGGDGVSRGHPDICQIVQALRHVGMLVAKSLPELAKRATSERLGRGWVPFRQQNARKSGLHPNRAWLGVTEQRAARPRPALRSR
jgi:hypothetical protein